MLHIADPDVRRAVAALHAGDAAALAQVLDANPELVRRPASVTVEAGGARFDYFADPKLLWFVAYNPIPDDERMPRNIVEIAQLIIARGTERDDITRTLKLVMSGRIAREQQLQRPLIRALRAAGAEATEDAIAVAAAHRELDAVRAVVESGVPQSLPIAGALGDTAFLERHVPAASAEARQLAFALAAINGHVAATRLLIDAGAAIDAFLPVHAHSTALHQAAGSDDVAMIDVLLAAGANTAIADTMWHGTPLGWAIHAGSAAAEARLRAAGDGAPRARRDRP